MPNITEYNSTQALQGLQPNNLGAEATANAARHIEALSSQAGERLGSMISRVGGQVGDAIDRHNAMQEIGTGAAAIANQTAAWSQQWNERFAHSDINDPTTADTFRKEVLEPGLEQWLSGFSTKQGQEWALSHADAVREHFFTKTQADMMNRAGDAVIANAQTTINAAAAASMNDPEGMQFHMDQVASSLKAMAANSHAESSVVSKLITEDINKANTQIAEATAWGLGAKDPDKLDAAIASGQFSNYVDATKLKGIAAFSREQRRANVEAQRKAESDNAKSILNDKYMSLITPDGHLAVPKDFYLGVKASGAALQHEPEETRAMIEMARSITANPEEPQTDPHIYSDFASRMLLPASDPNHLSVADIYRARTDRALNDKDTNFFKDAVENLAKDPAKSKAVARYKLAIESFKSSITKSSLLGADPQGDQRYGLFQQEAYDQFDSAYKAGNWQDLLNPTSQFWIGKTAGRYMLDSKAGMDEYMKNLTNGPSLVTPPAPAPQRKSGESPADYLKRVGGQ